MPMRLVYYSISLLIVGSSIGTAHGAHVVIDASISTAYETQPGWQEWVTAIECISATGEKNSTHDYIQGYEPVDKLVTTTIATRMDVFLQRKWMDKQLSWYGMD